MLEKLFIEISRSLRVVLNKCQSALLLNRFKTKVSIYTRFRFGNRLLMLSINKLITNSLFVGNWWGLTLSVNILVWIIPDSII